MKIPPPSPQPHRSERKSASSGKGTVPASGRVGQWEEDSLVDALVALLPPVSAEEAWLGPGDDCAWVSAEGPGGQLLKVDALVEGVHFLREHPARDVGWKALARPLSDIGAMGGEPRFALITVAVPTDLPVDYLFGIYRGLARAARRFAVGIVGGETCRSPGGIFLSVALTGAAAAAGALTRTGARPGDEIWVTGVLGRSYASGHHLRFVPRVREAGWLRQHFGITAMMDLSDGLGADLPRLARGSGLEFILEEKALPRRRGASLTEALGDGEDYELLFTLPPDQGVEMLEKWRREFPKVRLSPIGRMVAEGGQELSVKGFAHFRNSTRP